MKAIWNDAVLAQSDDPFTDKVNEGRWGSGYDDPFTPEINEGGDRGGRMSAEGRKQDSLVAV